MHPRVVAIAALLALTPGCGKPHKSEDRRTGIDAMAGRMEPAADPAVAPKPGLHERVAAIRELIRSTEAKKRREGAAALGRLVELVSPADRRRLADRLIYEQPEPLALAGVRLWYLVKRSEPKDVVLAMIGATGHTSDKVRFYAMRNLAQGVEKAALGRRELALRRVVGDGSCLVRYAAIDVLVDSLIARGKRAAAKPIVLGSLTDQCGIVQAWAAARVRKLFSRKNAPPHLAKVLLRLAVGHRLFHLRCAALLTLGHLKVATAEKPMAEAFEVTASTALDVLFQSDKSPYNFHLRDENMARCAASALRALHGRTPRGDRRAQAEAWWRETARKRLVRKAPSRVCTVARECNPGTWCVRNGCVSAKEAAKLYWSYVTITRCPLKRFERTHRNVGDQRLVGLGLASHRGIERSLPAALKKADPAAFNKQDQRIRSRSCRATK